MPNFTFYDYRKKLWSSKHAIRSVKLIRKRFDLVENSGSHWIWWCPKQLRQAVYMEYNWWAKNFLHYRFSIRTAFWLSTNLTKTIWDKVNFKCWSFTLNTLVFYCLGYLFQEMQNCLWICKKLNKYLSTVNLHE